MFVLTVIKDQIRIHPSRFGAAVLDSLVEEIDAKYANQVFPGVGLCVSVWDFVEVGEAHSYPGDGNAFVSVTFRMIVFRPFIGEVLQGHICGMDEKGIHVSLDFFQDIIVSPQLLPATSSFNHDTKAWTWHFETEAAADNAVPGAESSQDFPFEEGGVIRVRVTAVEYSTAMATAEADAAAAEAKSKEEAAPDAASVFAVAAPGSIAAAAAAGAADRPAAAAAGAKGAAAPRFDPHTKQRLAGGEPFETTAAKMLPTAPAMQVLASAAEEGLGLVVWWGDD